MIWRRHAEIEPPARETLASAAAAVLGCKSDFVSVLYNRFSKSTRVGVVYNSKQGFSVVLDSELSNKLSTERVRVWEEAARAAAHDIFLASTEAEDFAASAVPTIPMHNHQTCTTAWHGGTYGTYQSGYVGAERSVYVNPMLPKVGDAVRDANGLVVGIMCADGTIEPVVESLRKAIAAIESDGVPVEPTVIRRAIDLTFGGKGKR